MNRREFLKYILKMGSGALCFGLTPWTSWAESLDAQQNTEGMLRKFIPSSGEQIPVIGMGTWQTFDVGNNTALRDARTQVLRRFFEMGGGMIDSSPMYGSAEDVIGYGLNKLGSTNNLFSASKVWTMFKKGGPEQFQDSQRLWGLKQFDLFQVHNLLNWEDHLKYLNELKQDGQIRYVGITTSHGRRHYDFLKLMASQPLDFIQVTYNIADREVEEKILPLAADRGIAVIANRPYQGGRLINRLERTPLPEWAKEFDCDNWPQFLLKFIVSHPAVTCTIPATTQVEHMTENMQATLGRMPNAAIRKRMIDWVMGV